MPELPPGERIGRLFVHDEVYQRLRQWIIEGQLAPETRLRDKEIAETFGVSRTPVRESLLRLEAEGLVITHPNRSTVVAPLDWPVVLDRYPLIWTLERYAVTTVSADVWTPDLLTRLAAYNRDLNSAVSHQDALAATKADEAFHAALVSAARNPELQHILAELKTPLARVEVVYFHQIFSQQSVREHEQILQGLQTHNVEQAAYAVEQNWRQSLDRIHRIIAVEAPNEGTAANLKTDSEGNPLRRIPREH